MIVIIGAGPAGMAIAAELARCGREYRVLERHTVGYAWQNHYDRLHLHTLKQVSGLPTLPMPKRYPDFPSRTQFLSYLQQYAKQLDLQIDEGIELRRADYTNGRWQLDTSSGPQEAQILVMATGIWSAPRRPSLPGEAQFGGPIIHSREYRNPTPFHGQRVLVVGVGNSGSEIAVDLAEHGVAAAVAVRSGAAFGPKLGSAVVVRAASWLLGSLPRPVARRLLRRRDFSQLGLPLPPGSPLDHFPVVGYDLPDAVAAGNIAVYKALVGLEPGVARFSDGQSAAFDAVILATGYRPALDPVAHELTFDSRGRPLLDRYWRACRNPALVCIGYTYPTTKGWLQAIGPVARTAAAGIVRLLDADRSVGYSHHASGESRSA